MITALSPSLAFRGNARGALDHYQAVFPGSEVGSIVLYGPDEEGAEGTVRLAVLRIGSQELRLIDVPDEDFFAFTAGVSVFATCDSAGDVDDLAPRLGEGGETLMKVDRYPFAERYTWLSDKFGVNWQLIYGPRLEAST